MAPIEPGENLGQERLGVIVRNSEPGRASEAFARQRRQRPGLDLDDAPREFNQSLALGGEPRPAPVLDEQGAAQLLLQSADVHRNGRLSLMHTLRCLGERAHIDDGEERTKLVGVEHGNLSGIAMSYSTNIRWTDQWARTI